MAVFRCGPPKRSPPHQVTSNSSSCSTFCRRLVDKSLVVVEDSTGDEITYRMLETMRQYGSDQAQAAGELLALRDAHTSWWTEWMEAKAPTVPTDQCVAEIAACYDNCRAALEWTIDQPPLAAADHPLPDGCLVVHRAFQRRDESCPYGRGSGQRRCGVGRGHRDLQLLQRGSLPGRPSTGPSSQLRFPSSSQPTITRVRRTRRSRRDAGDRCRPRTRRRDARPHRTRRQSLGA